MVTMRFTSVISLLAQMMVWGLGLQDPVGMLGELYVLMALLNIDIFRLWARLILHFWALETEADANRIRSPGETYEPNPVECLQKAYEQTIEATSEPNKWQGTTTATGAQLYFRREGSDPKGPSTPLLYVTNLGDSQVLVLRPRNSELIYKTTEQWHWFDCPRQLGTNSPDTPRQNAVMDKVGIEENDVVLAMSDGVIDNLWEHEIIENVVGSIQKWESGQGGESTGDRCGGAGGGMKFVAEELMKAAKVIATDPFAESPFMEHAVEEGLAMEGGLFIYLPRRV
jgi:protein phosphatase PTC7